MKRFELWLDESGEFDNDRQKVRRGMSVSHIGGLFVESGTFPMSRVGNIIQENYFHSTEEANPDLQFARFKQLAETDARFVLFQNEECILVLDHNLTYQNMMAEGLIKLIKRLKSEYGDISLKILIANRIIDRKKKHEGDRGNLVPPDHYVQRLKERIIMAGLRESVPETDWTLQTASAHTDKRLMLADIVCNTFLTRNTKFRKDPAQSDFINRIYEDKEKTLRWPVFEMSVESEFLKAMTENRLGEAVAVLCQSGRKTLLDKYMPTVYARLEEMPFYDMDLQYRFISTLIDHQLRVSRDYDACLRLLTSLRQYFLPVLQKIPQKWSREIADRLSVDLCFYLDTVYTHQGNVAASLECEKLCDQEMAKLPYDWDSVAYRMRYLLRKVVTRINRFDFQEALTQCDQLVLRCENVREALELTSDGDRPVRFVELAKALGTRVQIKGFLLRQHPEYYPSACADSDRAIEEFDSENEKRRQYLYRVHLETEAGQYEPAFCWLLRAAGMEAADAKALISSIASAPRQDDYLLMAYIRLMAEGQRAGWPQAAVMYTCLSQTNILPRLQERTDVNHPFEICMWKTASCLAWSGNTRAARKYYARACDACFGRDSLTLTCIGIAVELEQYAFEQKNRMPESKKTLQSLKKHLQSLDGQASPFDGLTFDSEDWTFYENMSRRITY